MVNVTIPCQRISKRKTASKQTNRYPHLDQPLDQLHERQMHRRIPHFFDDQNGEGRFVPRQPLTGRILDGPETPTERVQGLVR
jgi:hypothetical protein